VRDISKDDALMVFCDEITNMRFNHSTSTMDSMLSASFFESDIIEKNPTTLNKRRTLVGDFLKSNSVSFDMSRPRVTLTSCMKRNTNSAEMNSVLPYMENDMVVLYWYKQVSSVVAPVFSEKTVDTHAEHKWFPVSFLNFPATHSLHKSCPSDFSLPGSHLQLSMLSLAFGPWECIGQS
jgi:hypothetical protein